MVERPSEVPATDQLGPETEPEQFRRKSQEAIADQFKQMKEAGTRPGLIRQVLEWIASGFRNPPPEK